MYGYTINIFMEIIVIDIHFITEVLKIIQSNTMPVNKYKCGISIHFILSMYLLNIFSVFEKNVFLYLQKDKSLTLLALEKCEHILNSKDIPYNKFKCCAVANIMDAVLDTYDG